MVGGVPLLERELLGVLEAEAPLVREGVGEALTVELAESVEEGVKDPVPVPLEVGVPVAVPVAAVFVRPGIFTDRFASAAHSGLRV